MEGLAFSPDLKRLFVMSSNCHPSTSVHLNVWTADILSKRKTDLSRISALAMQINGLNSYVRESVAALKTECKNITQSLKKQVDLLNAIIEEHGRKQGYTL